jgi:hypothetical protein
MPDEGRSVTIADYIASLQSIYADPDQIDHELAVERLLRRCDEAPPDDPDWYRSVFRKLDERRPCSLAVAELTSLLPETHEKLSTGQAVRCGAITAAAVVVVDATLQYPQLERRATTRALNDAIREGLTPEAVGVACERAYSIGRAVTDGAAIKRLGAVFPHPDDTRTEFTSLVKQHLSLGAFESIRALQKEMRHAIDAEWTQADLLEFSPTGFEELLADCWRDYRNAAMTTQGSQDRGIDLIVRTGSGRRLAVQAKRYRQSNRVGIATVQRTAGLTREFDIDGAVVVTSNRFTSQAADSADEIDVVRLVNGERLCAWLTASSLAPPFLIGRQ